MEKVQVTSHGKSVAAENLCCLYATARVGIGEEAAGGQMNFVFIAFSVSTLP